MIATPVRRRTESGLQTRSTFRPAGRAGRHEAADRLAVSTDLRL